MNEAKTKLPTVIASTSASGSAGGMSLGEAATKAAAENFMTKIKANNRKGAPAVAVQRSVRHRGTDWQEIAEGLYFALNNDGVNFNNPLSKIMAESTSKKYERAKGIAHDA